MPKAIFHFYEELNDLLPRHRQKTDFDPSFSPRDIIRLSGLGNRIILTKSGKLLKFKEVTHGILIRPGKTTQQIKRIIAYLDIRKLIRPFTMCLVCGFLLEPVSKDRFDNRIPPKTKEFCDQYAYCGRCDKIYWNGTHYLRIKEVVDEIIGS